MKSQYFIRNLQSVYLLESFFVSAVASILVIRFYLEITNYPKLGGGVLHIAHMLWGGLFMLIALVLLLTFLDKPLKHISAIIGGIGFGTFIDELGKFITRDNNYFFQPTIALLYVIFVLLYFIFRYIDKHTTIAEEEYIANALEYVREAAVHDLHPEERQKAIDLLAQTPVNPLSQQLSSLLLSLPVQPEAQNGVHYYYTKVRSALHAGYAWLIAQHWFINCIVTVFIIASCYYFVTAVMAVFDYYPYNFVFGLLRVLSSFASFCFVVRGVLVIRHSRLQAYLSFERALLISLFLTQFFSFYVVQLMALIELVINIITLYIVRYAIVEEKRRLSVPV